MSEHVKGLNAAGGRNRYRFHTFAERVRQIDVDVQRVARGHAPLNALASKVRDPAAPRRRARRGRC